MSAVNRLHDEAMDLAAFAMMERARGNSERATELFEMALEKELEAISELHEPVEPSFSVLHRSAASLALDCKQFRRAEQLVAKALAEEPPPEIAEELRDVWEQATFQRHLALKGVSLGEDELQMSLSGPAVGYGLVGLEELFERAISSSKLVYRLVEWKGQRPYRDRGNLTNDIRRNYQPHISVPRAASFAITLKFNNPIQPSLPNMSGALNILDEFMDFMELVNDSEVPKLQERVPELPYLRNFLALTRKIAPDGTEISQVGLTLTRNGSERFVSVTRPASDFPLPPVQESSVREESVPVELRGILRFADATGSSNDQIKILDINADTTHTVEVPEGMMNDIVRPMWDSVVAVTGVRTGRQILLQDIRKAPAD